MTATTQTETDIREILGKIARGEAARLTLPGGGLLSVDRGLPFLIVHRARPGGKKDDGTPRLVSGEASFLLAASGNEDEVAELISRIAEAGSAAFGAFLVLELWTADGDYGSRFTVHGPDGPAPETVGALVAGIREMEELLPGVQVTVDHDDARHPPGLPPLLAIRESWERGILLIGLEVPPAYQEPGSGRIYPRFLRRFQRRLSKVLRQALYEFLRVQTTSRVENYRALGTRSVPDAVWTADREFSRIERSFEMLLLTSPVNEDEEWSAFQESGFERNPEFHYRLLPIDPDLLKRRLFAVPLEEIDDPALASLFQDKRQELDRQLGMLDERGSPAFRYSSMRLFGAVDDELLQVANDLLHAVSPSRARRPGPVDWVDAEAFRVAAVEEVEQYAVYHPPILERSIEIRPDIGGLMVSEGNLMIGEALRLRPERVSALLHHEVGTHVLTYVNGAAQPLEQLSLGLADYDELQEGLAVLAEYLVGGLDRSRMRLLAARVVAARSCEEGGSFVDTFRLIRHEHGFSPAAAWNITTRIHQSGGFTRDLIYLRGLIRLLSHLKRGGELDLLYMGKIAQRHLPIVQELRDRGVLRDPPLIPRILTDPEARDRLEAVRAGIELTDLIRSEAA